MLSKTKEEPELILEIVPGLLLLFNYFAHDVSGEEILKSLDAYGNMQWVEFRHSDTDGHICFDTAEQASTAIAKIPVNEVMFVGLKHNFELLRGQTKQVFWEDAHCQRIEVRNRKPAGTAAATGRVAPNAAAAAREAAVDVAVDVVRPADSTCRHPPVLV